MTRFQTALTLMAALFGAAFFVSAQRPSAPGKRVEFPYFETMALTPREVKPAQYAQVPQRDVEVAASEGWELVSVAPYVLRNEARGPAQDSVTQAYPAYYFKRLRPDR